MFASSGASSSYLASITHAAPSRLTWMSLMVGYSTMSISKCLSIAVRIACASAAPIPIAPVPGRPADQVLLGHIAPAAPVVAVVAIVAHHQIMPRRHVADKRLHAAASGGVLVPADVAAHAAAVARRQHRLTIEGHRTEYGLVLMAAETLL